MNITSDPNLWAICALTFLLGLLIGIFMTAGGRRKWKTRYHDEISRRETIERSHKDRETEWATRDKERDAHWATREKDWREQDSLRGASARDSRAMDHDNRIADRDGDGYRDGPVVGSRDSDGDGVPNRNDRNPVDDRRS